MRPLHLLVSTALLLATAGPLYAQEDSVDFVSKEDFFSVTFPGKPTVTEGTWVTEYGVVLSSKVYTVDTPHSHNVLTVVDYTPVERVLTQKSHEKCPIGSDTCNGLRESGLGYWKDEYRGAVNYAISTLLVDKDVKVTHTTFHFIMLVAGQELVITSLKDESQTVAAAYMHKNRLVFSVSTTPKGWPVSRAMQASLSWHDGSGRGGGRPQLYRNDPERDEPGVAFQPVR
jgi:hypothetical protein